MMRFLEGDEARRAAVRAAVRARSATRSCRRPRTCWLSSRPRSASCRRRRGARRGEPDPAHHRRPGRRGARHASPDRRWALLRGPEDRKRSGVPRLRRGADAEVPRLARARARAQPRRAKALAGRRAASPMPTCRYSSSSRACATPFPNAMARTRARRSRDGRAARPGRGAAAHRGVPRLRAADCRSTSRASSGAIRSSTAGERRARPVRAGRRRRSDSRGVASVSGVPGRARDDVHEVARGNRLRRMHLESGRQRLRAVLAPAVGRQRHGDQCVRLPPPGGRGPCG